MIQLNDVAYEIGERTLFEHLDLIINANDRLGIAGPNGSGKTTILRVILGEAEPARGRVERARSMEVGYLPQEAVLIRGRSLVDEVLADCNAITDQLKQLEARLGTAAGRTESDLARYGELQHRFETMGGWGMRSRALKIIIGLGFEEGDVDKPVESFSAGWQMRINLARMLLDEPDCLILDEPTNHLDIESIAWFEEYLDSFAGAIIMVSHDRVFMNHVLDGTRGHKGILECENGRVRLFRGNFSAYEAEREVRRTHLVKAARDQQKKIGDIKKFIDKYHAHKAKAGLVKSRERTLERMEIIEVEYERKRIRVRFPVAPVESKRLLTLNQVAKSYDGNYVFADLDMYIDKGEKVALIGKNGAGKSTLCRIAHGTEPASSGLREVSDRLIVSAFFQEQVRCLPAEDTVVDWATRQAPEEVQPQIRGFLGMFLFSGDDIEKRISVLSGGEKTRLVILSAMLAGSNLLILDEPTYHLDRDSIEALMEAVKHYSGAVLLVTHDRDLVAKFATRILELAHGKLTSFPGDYEYYLWKKKGVEPRAAKVLPPKDAAVGGACGKDELERRLRDRESRLGRLEERFRKPGGSVDAKKIKALLAQRSRLEEEIQDLREKLTAGSETN